MLGYQIKMDSCSGSNSCYSVRQSNTQIFPTPFSSLYNPEKTVKYPIFLMFSTRHIDGFSTNLRNLRSLEVIDFVDGLKKEFLMYVAWGHLDLVSASRMNQTSWQIEQFSAQSMQGSRAPLS